MLRAQVDDRCVIIIIIIIKHDKVILSRAWASLPLVLQIFRLLETDSTQSAGRWSLCSAFPLRKLF